MRLIMSLVMGCSLLAGCASTRAVIEGEADLVRTWSRAAVAVPAPYGDARWDRMNSSQIQQQLARVSGPGLPLVIYMHGCTALSGADYDYIEELAEAGYLVIAPDSMARSWRPMQCNPVRKTGGHNLFVYDMRQAEINFALDQIRAVRWADWDNLFLIGASEGGLAVAHHRSDKFKARVITQWTCHGAWIVRGLTGPPDMPTLSVVRQRDPWYNTDSGGQRGDCGAFFTPDAIANGSRSIVLEKGKDHNVLDEDKVLKEIITFFDSYRGAGS